jgi:hypothetical protein
VNDCISEVEPRPTAHLNERTLLDPHPSSDLPKPEEQPALAMASDHRKRSGKRIKVLGMSISKATGMAGAMDRLRRAGLDVMSVPQRPELVLGGTRMWLLVRYVSDLLGRRTSMQEGPDRHISSRGKATDYP